MAPQGQNNPRRGSEQEDQAFKEGKARLDELARQLVDTESDLKEDLYELVEGYKAKCRRIIKQRAQIIQDVSTKNEQAGRYLENEKLLRSSVPECMLWMHKGVLISYEPDVDDTPPLEPEESKALGSLGNENQKISDVPVPPPEAERAIASTGQPGSNPVPQYSSRLRKAVKPPIAMPFTRNYWIFEYDFKGGSYLFVLRCPNQTCHSPIFSHHPLKHGRALKHFKSCGVRVRNERDMVRRYAWQVIPDRKDREVTLAWARRQNLKLVGSNERHLEEENL